MSEMGYRLSVETLKKCLAGELGTVRIAEAQDELDRCADAMKNSMGMDADGAIYWKKSGNYVNREMCEKLELAGCNFSIEATQNKYSLQMSRVLNRFGHKH